MAAARKPIKKSLKEYARGITGGLLFSLPMLYTMEFWWIGYIASPIQLIIYFSVGILLLMIYNHYVGIRTDHSFWNMLVEAVEEMGLGLLVSVFILWTIGRFSPDLSIAEISGKVIVEAVTVAIGISVGKAQLGAKDDEVDEGDEDTKPDKVLSRSHHLMRGINIALCGAILIAANIAPTEEVVVIAVEADNVQLMIIALLSLSIGGAVLYYINFTGAHKLVSQPNNQLEAVAGTVIMYAVALVASAFMLWFFGRFNGVSLYAIVAQTVVLGFPAALGASAGRLLIQV